jgi:hypothetical protein
MGVRRNKTLLSLKVAPTSFRNLPCKHIITVLGNVYNNLRHRIGQVRVLRRGERDDGLAALRLPHPQGAARKEALVAAQGGGSPKRPSFAARRAVRPNAVAGERAREEAKAPPSRERSRKNSRKRGGNKEDAVRKRNTLKARCRDMEQKCAGIKRGEVLTAAL